MAVELPAATRRLMERVPGIAGRSRFFPDGTKTAGDAALAIGCPVAAIVKSLVFVVEWPEGAEPVVALVPGDLMLDTGKLADAAGGSRARRATLDEVKEATGYAAGGTPPFGHDRQLRVFADPELKRNDPVWAAGGTPNTVFPISIAELDEWASPIWADITQSG
ncbi:MAG TPA: YbaK/EbsC family protein [Acidimicrobiia bacterium]